MKIDIQFRPSYSLAIVNLEPNEKIRAEAGAMVSMSEGMMIETKAEGGILKSLGRSFLGGESFFQNFYQAPAQGGEIALAPELPGDIFVWEMTNEDIIVQSGSFMACETGVEIDASLSMKGFKTGEGFSVIKARGSGKLLLSSYGAIHEKILKANEKYIVDTSHLVAFDANMGVETKTIGGIKSTVFSGEGLVAQLTGPGKIMIQTRAPQALINWIIPQLPKTD